MGSCCTSGEKPLKKIRSNNAIIDLPTQPTQQTNKIIIVTPHTKKPVPQLKKLTNNPLYKRRRRKSLNDAKLHEIPQLASYRQKRLTTNSELEKIKNRLYLNTFSINGQANSKAL